MSHPGTKIFCLLNVYFVRWGLSVSLDLGSGTWRTSVTNSLWPHCPYTRLDTEAVFWDSFKLSLNHITGHSLAKFSTYSVCFLEHMRIFYVTFHFTEKSSEFTVGSGAREMAQWANTGCCISIPRIIHITAGCSHSPMGDGKTTQEKSQAAHGAASLEYEAI